MTLGALLALVGFETLTGLIIWVAAWLVVGVLLGLFIRRK